MISVLPVDYPTPGYMTQRALAGITLAIVHHTAGSKSQMPLDIDAEHRAIGDAMIAYNRIITPDGKIYMGRPDDFVPAAAYGANSQSIDIVLVGQFQPSAAGYTGPPTDAQLDSLLQLLIGLHRAYPTINKTIGHRDVAAMYPGDEADYSTACPGDDLYAKLPDIKSKVAAAINVH